MNLEFILAKELPSIATIGVLAFCYAIVYLPYAHKKQREKEILRGYEDKIGANKRKRTFI